MMSYDFKAQQLQVNKLINSGNFGGNAPLLIYGIGSATDQIGGINASHFEGTGSDVWMFISGTRGSADSNGSFGTVAFKGDVVVSGALQLGESIAPGTPASGKGVLYVKASDSLVYFKNDLGSEYNLATTGAPGGSDKQIQFNDGGSAFNGDANFTFDKTIQRVEVTGSLAATLGFTGSLTKLATGGDYLVAGANITLITGSNGNVTISAAMGGSVAGSNTQVQFNDNGAFGAVSTFAFETGSDRLVVTNLSAATITASYISPASPLVVRPQGSTLAAASDTFFFVSGSETSDYSLFGGSVISSGSVIVKTLSNKDAVKLSSTGYISGSDALLIGGAITVGGGSNSTAHQITGSVSVSNGITGSLTKLATGGDYLIAGTNITLVTGSGGDVTISAAGGGGGSIAGSNTQVQYNNDGAFGAKSTFTFATGSNRLSVTHISASTVTASFISPGSPLVIRPQGSSLLANSDTFFFVSGSETSDFAVFGGQIVSSGSIRVKNNLSVENVQITTNGVISGSGALTAGGATTLNSTLNVVGLTTLNVLTASGGVQVKGPNVAGAFAVTDAPGANNKFTVNGSTGEVSGSGNLLSGGGLTVASAAALNSTLNVVGVSTLNVLTASGGVQVKGPASPTAFAVTDAGGGNNRFVVDGINGNVSGSGTLQIASSITIGGSNLNTIHQVTGSLVVSNGISGSLTKLSDGTTDYLFAGQGILLSTGSGGTVTITGGGGASPFNVFTTTVGSPFTLAIPSQCSIIEIEACGGGGGGGAGGKFAAPGNPTLGGGGGAGGGYSFISLNASTIRALSANLTITVGPGGTGAATNTTDSNPGGNGGNGLATTVAAGATTILFAPGGSGGSGGGSGGGGTGGGFFVWKDQGGAGANSNSGGVSIKPALAGYAGGGGGGGALTAGPTAYNGGDGGTGGDIRADNVSRSGLGGAPATYNGTSATAPAAYAPTGGGGGGGGASRGGGGAAGKGGNGIQGGGGGGGGANLNLAGNDAGGGGNGGAGWCVVRFS